MNEKSRRDNSQERDACAGCYEKCHRFGYRIHLYSKKNIHVSLLQTAADMSQGHYTSKVSSEAEHVHSGFQELNISSRETAKVASFFSSHFFQNVLKTNFSLKAAGSGT